MTRQRIIIISVVAAVVTLSAELSNEALIKAVEDHDYTVTAID